MQVGEMGRNILDFRLDLTKTIQNPKLRTPASFFYG
jgi:hypothetical protein